VVGAKTDDTGNVAIVGEQSEHAHGAMDGHVRLGQQRPKEHPVDRRTTARHEREQFVT
jgi:hypothetical protein